jgi:hypothetical protein
LRATVVVAAVALFVRAAVVAWAHARFPPIADGTYYDMFATRLATGLGYTVAWPDGVVTFAAHYPVGYPAMLSLAYRLFGASIGVAMCVNAAIGVVSAACAHRLAVRELSPRVAFVAAMVFALHPALVLYTPAIMTESVAISLVVVALACAPFGKDTPKRVYVARIVAMGAVFGLATLVRPQVIALAPLLAFVVTRRVLVSAAVLGVALVTVSPWTARNCVRMNRCALVSVNGGWNLLIGARTDTGSWTALEAPDDCKEVWDEAAKDACFEHAARREIAAAPVAWLEKIPKKLGITLDVLAAGPSYMHRSNPRAFGERAVLLWGAVETLATRLLMALGMLAAAPLFRLRVRRKRWRVTAPRFALGAVGICFAFARHAWPAWAILAILCLWRERSERRSMLRLSSGIVIAATMLTHAVFFGAGRYGLLVVPLSTLAAFACVRPKGLTASAS